MRGSIIRDSFDKVWEEYLTLSKKVKELKGKSFEEALELSSKTFSLDYMRKAYGEDFLYDLFICMAKCNALKNSLEKGIQFHISDKSYMDLVDKPFHDMEGYTKEYLNSIPIPFEYFSISFEGEDGKTDEGVYTLASLSEDGKGLLIYHFFEHALIVRGHIVFDKLPRVYIACGDSKKCDKYNEVTNAYSGTKACMKTTRNCDTCPLVNEDPMGIRRSIPVAKILAHSMLMIFEVMRKFNAPPEVITKIREDIKSRTKSDTTTKEYNPINIIEVGKKRYKYLGYEVSCDDDTEKTPRMSPCEHPRKGYERTLKSGKVITIAPVIVNKGKGKKVFKV